MLKFSPKHSLLRGRPHPMVKWALTCAALYALCTGGVWAQAGQANRPGIYTCVDASGKRLTSDRLIADCLDREQRILNQDGSLRRVVAPRMNAQERAAQEARKREQALTEAAHKDAVRRDRNLLLRYPNEAMHAAARESAMDDVYKGVALSERRLQELRAERKALDAETEFYVGKRLPAKLRGQIEANDAQQQAQNDIIQQQQAERVRLNGIYDAELTKLRQLWAGAAPGTLKVPAAPEPLVSRPVSSSAAR